MKKNIFNKIFNEYKKNLKNLSKDNKKLIICFVGVPGSGKTKLSKILENKIKGIRINSDFLRKIINKKITKNEKECEELLREFILNLLNDYPFKNKLVILDSGIERKYKEISKVSKSKKWDMFIIKMIVPKHIIIKRIKIKDIKRFKERPEDIKRWFKEYKDFNKKVKSDFVFKKNSDLKELIIKLKA